MESEPSHLSLFKPTTNDLEDYILSKDIIYVGGGNTRNLLVLWKEWELDKIGSGEMIAGYAADDGVALHFIDDQLHKVVSSRPHAKGYRVYKEDGQVKESVLETIYLGDL